MPALPDISRILDEYKYLPYIILFVWTFLEGETIVILAGIAARDGKPWLPLVILAAFCGSLCSDQLTFFLGRLKGKAFIAKRPTWQVRAEKVYAMLERHQTWLILGFRFLYGLRNITPFAIGMSRVSTRRFITLNVIGAAVWATLFSFGGYIFGLALERTLKQHQKQAVLVALLIFMLVLWIVRIVRRRRNTRRLALERAASPAQSPSDK